MHFCFDNDSYTQFNNNNISNSNFYFYPGGLRCARNAGGRGKMLDATNIYTL